MQRRFPIEIANGSAGAFPAPSHASGMDVMRPQKNFFRRRNARLALYGALALLGAGGVSYVLAHLRPAAPAVDRSAVWVDAVQRGPLLRDVRGLGTLTPEEIRWIAARSEGRVERIAVWPGTTVQPDTVLIVLGNPELEQAVLDADAAVTAAQAKLVNLKAQLEGQTLERQAAEAKARGDRDTAIAQMEVNERLSQQGLIAAVELKKSRISAQMLTDSSEIERQRVDFARQAVEPQLAVARSEVDLARAQAALKRGQLDALQVRAGMAGVLQQIAVEAGQRVTAGASLARVADPARLKAQIKVPETQAKDIAPGLSANIDTRNGIVAGRVSRIDPAVTQGSVLVDVTFDGAPLPKGARPDLSVEGSIELERLPDAVFVGRPAFSQENSMVSLFKLTADGNEANRVRVRLGRGSINAVEIKEGLQPGDRVILSDTSAYDGHERIRLN